ncbi:MAG: hypothetical protein ABIJ56_20005 [Pseudomonadota bacterium]
MIYPLDRARAIAGGTTETFTFPCDEFPLLARMIRSCLQTLFSWIFLSGTPGACSTRRTM